MKSKSAIIAFLLSLAIVPAVHAKTDVVGDIYGDIVSIVSMNDITIPYSVTIDDLNTAGENCDNDKQTCYLQGFSWSDIVGWTSWDGKSLQTELGGSANFPDEYIAKATFNGNLGGYIWGEKYGWVQLSACSGIGTKIACEAKGYCDWTSNNFCEINKAERVPDVSSQTANDWGVYIDFCPLKTDIDSCESAESDQYCNWDSADSVCVFDGPTNPKGQPLMGYAWSEYLGWIKFGPEDGESSKFAGAFTKWYPDLTPPTFEALNISLSQGAWIPNESTIGIVTWPEFSDENDSLMDLIHSSITVSVDPSTDFSGCSSAIPQANGNLVMTQNGFGEINLTIPIIGKFVSSPLYGFCKYTLSGVVYNGSGFGYYFGAAGLAAGAAKGLDFTNPDPSSYAPNVYNPDFITLYVRAGDIDKSRTTIAFSGNGGVADGNNHVNLSFAPKDIGGNPIVPVKTAVVPDTLPEPDTSKWVRDVNLAYDLQSSVYAFDSLNFVRNLTYPAPLTIENNLYSFIDPLVYPLPPDTLPALPYSGNYLVDIVGYAPTSADNPLNLDEISLSAVDAEVPAISPTQPAKPAASNLTAFNSSSSASGTPLPYAYSFLPALEVTNGEVDSDFIVLGQPVTAQFDFKNNSSDPLPVYSLDNILTFKDSGGIGQAVLEVNNINLLGADPSDLPGRTDPAAEATRYELLHDSTETPASNQFHSPDQNYHDPIYDFSNPVDPDGIYQVDGKYYVAPSDPCLEASSCAPVDIDRSDTLSTNLDAGGIGSFTFSFMPSQYVGQAVNAQVTFAVDQYLAYQSPGFAPFFSQYAIYRATPFIDGIEVKSIGLGTSGIVGGEQVYESVSGRELQTISTTSSADLRRDIRKNVAVLTRNITPCTSLNVSSLPIDPALTTCLSVDNTNKTIVAIYSGSSSDTLELGGSAGNVIPVPADYKYTIILSGGLNLYLSDNLSYGGNTKNSLGIIVMQDDAGKGGNVYLDPQPTNMVGLLYAEGSLLSSPDGGTTFYNGAGGNVSDLKNQLYWQGSIASRNTIGGGPSKVVPDGVDCTPWGNRIADCAQAFDLDYVRRFTTVHATPENVDYSPAGYFFSGGGQCNPGIASDPGCALGGLPTTVSLSAGSLNVTASKSLDTFFIERDNRPVPPGFSSGGGLTSSQEIR